ncbi:hypothetical protein ACFX1Q_000112 [Malus domestica]
MLVLNGDDKLLTFLSYKKLFKVCFYCGRRAVEKCGCDMEKLEVSLFLVNKMFVDEPNMLPSGVKDDYLTLVDLEDDLILYFLQPASIKENGLRNESRVGLEGENGGEDDCVGYDLSNKKKKRCDG